MSTSCFRRYEGAMRESDSSTQHQRYQVLSAATSQISFLLRSCRIAPGVSASINVSAKRRLVARTRNAPLGETYLRIADRVRILPRTVIGPEKERQFAAAQLFVLPS